MSMLRTFELCEETLHFGAVGVDGCSFSGLPVKTTAVNILYFQMSGSESTRVCVCECACSCIDTRWRMCLFTNSEQRVFAITQHDLLSPSARLPLVRCFALWSVGVLTEETSVVKCVCVYFNMLSLQQIPNCHKY